MSNHGSAFVSWLLIIISASKEQNTLATSIVASADLQQKRVLLDWARELERIRSSPVSLSQKATQAVEATRGKGVIAPIVKANAHSMKQALWSDRGWPTRLAILGATVGSLGFSGKAAGLAAFGRAVAVPIWLVLASSGALLGTLIQGLQDALFLEDPSTTYRVIDAREARENGA